jgi:hypothetical protein
MNGPFAATTARPIASNHSKETQEQTRTKINELEEKCRCSFAAINNAPFTNRSPAAAENRFTNNDGKSALGYSGLKILITRAVIASCDRQQKCGS